MGILLTTRLTKVVKRIFLSLLFSSSGRLDFHILLDIKGPTKGDFYVQMHENVLFCQFKRFLLKSCLLAYITV